jgi:O-antigen/teichoic acid export membrane protein
MPPNNVAEIDSLDGRAMSPNEVARHAARGAGAYLLRNGAVQTMQILSSLVVARVLLPAEYGTFALATVLVGFARMAGDLGLSASMTVAPTLHARDLQAGTWTGVVLASCSAVAIGVIGYFVNASSPSVLGHLVTAALAVSLVVDATRFAPTLVLTRGLSFQRLAVVAMVETSALYIVQIGLLFAGAGIWALVVGQLVRAIVGAATVAQLGGGFVRPRPSAAMIPRIRLSLPFQGPAILAGLGGLVIPLLIAAQLGRAGVGFWAWATVLSAPFTAIFIGVHQISMASFARLRREVVNRATAAEELVTRVTLLTAAAAAGALFGVAPGIVRYVFGERWQAAVGAVQVNLASLVLLALVTVLAASLDGRIQPRRRLVAALVGTACAVAAVIPLSARFGVTGAAIAGAIVGPLVDAIILGRFARIRVTRALAGAIAVLLGAVIVSTVMQSTVHSWQTLVFAVAVSVAAAAALAAGADWQAVCQAREYLRHRTAPHADAPERRSGPASQ